ncbi:hypothetical protein SAMN05660337_1981 [Maridesulfovibrio ferrireducens]|uniref:Uncharacterized protein n=1 Tax=Maridesulfovibrio ferrireducens TaxID=246191 RepID=A0A1G9H3V1_9BACT|nr:hypothetical protein [Maridesulfovibrio ferrireducens]SDL07173.1 hypothetical protein SAMN05660337_1981 [Maridesulfovibrio ferrireducens]
MGGSGSKSPSAPVAPAPPPPVTAAPAPPVLDTDLQKSEEALNAKKMRTLNRLKKGRSATVLTSGEGVLGQTETDNATLLGQKTKLGQ